MVILQYVEVNGFRVYKGVSRLDIGPGINCLIGPNGSGKSSMIEALRILFDDHSVPCQLVLHKGNGAQALKGYVEAGVTLGEAISEEFLGEIWTADRDLVLRVTFSKCCNEKISTSINGKKVSRTAYRRYCELIRQRICIVRQNVLNEYSKLDAHSLSRLLLTCSGISNFDYMKEKAVKALATVQNESRHFYEVELKLIRERVTRLQQQSVHANTARRYDERIKLIRLALAEKNLELLELEISDLQKTRDELRQSLRTLSCGSTEVGDDEGDNEAMLLILDEARRRSEDRVANARARLNQLHELELNINRVPFSKEFVSTANRLIDCIDDTRYQIHLRGACTSHREALLRAECEYACLLEEQENLRSFQSQIDTLTQEIQLDSEEQIALETEILEQDTRLSEEVVMAGRQNTLLRNAWGPANRDICLKLLNNARTVDDALRNSGHEGVHGPLFWFIQSSPETDNALSSVLRKDLRSIIIENKDALNRVQVGRERVGPYSEMCIIPLQEVNAMMADPVTITRTGNDITLYCGPKEKFDLVSHEAVLLRDIVGCSGSQPIQLLLKRLLKNWVLVKNFDSARRTITAYTNVDCVLPDGEMIAHNFVMTPGLHKKNLNLITCWSHMIAQKKTRPAIDEDALRSEIARIESRRSASVQKLNSLKDKVGDMPELVATRINSAKARLEDLKRSSSDVVEATLPDLVSTYTRCQEELDRLFKANNVDSLASYKSESMKLTNAVSFDGNEHERQILQLKIDKHTKLIASIEKQCAQLLKARVTVSDCHLANSINTKESINAPKIHSEIARLTQQIVSIRDRRSEFSMEVERGTASEKLGCEFQDLREKPVATLQKFLDDATAGKSALGPVNYKAISNYDHVKVTAAEIESKFEKLTNRASRLESLLSQIDRNRQQAFRSFVETVNRRFEQITGLLDLSGSLELHYTDDAAPKIIMKVVYNNNILSGTSLMQLSGGQKSMLSLCLLASAYDPTQTVFILDEIDSALDDTNATTTSQILSKICAQTVVTTFNQKIIDKANTIFKVLYNDREAQVIRLDPDDTLV